MKPLFLPLLLAAGGLATGLAAGYHLAGKWTPGEVSTVNGGSSPAEARMRGGSNPRSEAHDLSSLLRVMRQHAALGDPTALREMERMSTTELGALIEELRASASSMPRGLSEEGQSINQLLEMASREWFRRDGEDALRQAEAMPAGDARRSTLYDLIRAAAREDPELAKPWIARFREEFGSDWAGGFAHPAIIGATGRGAEDLIRLKELYGDDLLGAAFPQGAYAEDFDFRRLITALGVGGELLEPMQNWGGRDPDAAWATTRELIARDEKHAVRYLTAIFRGISQVNDDTVAAAWLAEKIGEVPTDRRREVFLSLRSVEALQPERITAVMGALTTAEDKMEFAGTLISAHDDPGQVSLALNALDSDADREQVLMKFARELAPNMKSHEGTPQYQEASTFFDKTMDDAGLASESRERVRAALTGRK